MRGEGAVNTTNVLLNKSSAEIQRLERELEDLYDQLSQLTSNSNETMLITTATTAISIATTTTTSFYPTSTLNCSEILGPSPPPPLVYEFVLPSSDIKFNSENITNVTVVLVLGDTAEEVLNLATNSPEPVQIQCCFSDGG